MAETLKIGTGKQIKITIEGTTPQEIKAGVERLGTVPSSALNMPVKKSATKVAQLARKNAPRRTGAMRKGIKVRSRKEKTQKGKVVYDVWMDREMNDSFVKTSRSGKRYYYPGSQEYGFRTRNGRVQGLYFMKQAAADLSQYHEQLVLDELGKKLDKAWEKKNGGTST